MINPKTLSDIIEHSLFDVGLAPYLVKDPTDFCVVQQPDGHLYFRLQVSSEMADREEITLRNDTPEKCFRRACENFYDAIMASKAVTTRIAQENDKVRELQDEVGRLKKFKTYYEMSYQLQNGSVVPGHML